METYCKQLLLMYNRSVQSEKKNSDYIVLVVKQCILCCTGILFWVNDFEKKNIFLCFSKYVFFISTVPLLYVIFLVRGVKDFPAIWPSLDMYIWILITIWQVRHGLYLVHVFFLHHTNSLPATANIFSTPAPLCVQNLDPELITDHSLFCIFRSTRIVRHT